MDIPPRGEEADEEKNIKEAIESIVKKKLAGEILSPSEEARYGTSEIQKEVDGQVLKEMKKRTKGQLPSGGRSRATTPPPVVTKAPVKNIDPRVAEAAKREQVRKMRSIGVVSETPPPIIKEVPPAQAEDPEKLARERLEHAYEKPTAAPTPVVAPVENREDPLEEERKSLADKIVRLGHPDRLGANDKARYRILEGGVRKVLEKRGWTFPVEAAPAKEVPVKKEEVLKAPVAVVEAKKSPQPESSRERNSSPEAITAIVNRLLVKRGLDFDQRHAYFHSPGVKTEVDERVEKAGMKIDYMDFLRLLNGFDLLRPEDPTPQSKEAGLPPLSPRVTSAAPEAPPSPVREAHPVSPYVAEIMGKLQLAPTFLQSIAPDFFTLDDNKQIYALEKIRQKVNQESALLAEKKVDEDLSKKTKFFSKAGLQKIWKKWTKENEQVKARREILGKAKERGMVDYAEDIDVVVEHVKDLDMSISYENGRLSIEYVNKNDFKWDSEFLKRFRKGESPDDYVDRVNEAATAFSELPFEWGMPGAGIAERLRYEKARHKYKIARSVLFGAVESQSKMKMPEKDAEALAMQWMNGLDSKITTNQLLTTHPDIDKYENSGLSFNLDDINPDNAKWGLAKLGFVAGMGARILTRKTSGMIGAAIVGGALGGFLAGRKKWLEYSKKEKKMRYGAEVEDKDIKKYIKAEEALVKLEGLIGRFDAEEDEVKKASLGGLLRRRAMVLDRRIKEGRVNFGGPKERLANQLDLIQAIAEANAKSFTVGVFEDVEDSRLFQERFNKFQKDGEKKWAQRLAIGKAAAWGAIKTSVFSAAGFMVTDYVREIGSGQAFVDRLKEIFTEGGEGKWNDVAPGFRESVPANVSASIEPPPEVVVDEKPSGVTTDVSKAETATPSEQPTEAKPVSEAVAPEAIDPESLKANVREIMKDGKIVKIEIYNKSLVPEVREFNALHGQEKFLYGITAHNFRDEAKEFLALKYHLKLYPEGSDQHDVILKQMRELGEEITKDNRNTFPPYQEMFSGSDGSEIVPSETETTNFEQVKAEKIADGFEHTRSGYSDVFSKEVPLNAPEDLADNLEESGAADPEIAKEAAENIGRDSSGNLAVLHTEKVEEAMRFRQFKREFLVKDMSKWDLSKNYHTEGWGIKALNNVSGQAEQFLALQEYLKGYEEGSEMHAKILERMGAIGKDIHEKAGNIFAPYEEWASEVSPSEISPDATASLGGAPIESPPSPSPTPIESAPTPEATPSAPVETKAPAIETPAPSTEASSAVRLDDSPNIITFNEGSIEGRVVFERDPVSDAITGIKEMPGFRTAMGQDFRNNPFKYITEQDVEKAMTNFKAMNGTALPKAAIFNMFEKFINDQTILEHGLKAGVFSPEEMNAFQREMEEFDNFVMRYVDGHDGKTWPLAPGINGRVEHVMNFGSVAVPDPEDLLEETEKLAPKVK